MMAVVIFHSFKHKDESMAVAKFYLIDHGFCSVLWNAQIWRHNLMQKGDSKLAPHVNRLKEALLQWGKLW